MSEHNRSTKTRTYRMRKRAEQMAETRRRIVEAAVRLHTTVGPGRTTISGVAEEAGVTRATVYRHFPDEEQLFAACTTHWTRLHPGPDPSRWREIHDLGDRARTALRQVYGFYRENHPDLERILADLEALPARAQRAASAQQAAMVAALIEGTRLRGRRRRRLEAVAGHVTSFSTWRSLVVEQGLDGGEAVEVAAAFLSSAAH